MKLLPLVLAFALPATAALADLNHRRPTDTAGYSGYVDWSTDHDDIYRQAGANPGNKDESRCVAEKTFALLTEPTQSQFNRSITNNDEIPVETMREMYVVLYGLRFHMLAHDCTKEMPKAGELPKL